MPRYGAKVKSLLITRGTDVDLWNFSHRIEILAAQHTLDAAERFMGLEVSSAKPFVRASEFHDALIAAIVRACSNVVALKLIQRASKPYIARNKGGEVVVRSSRTDDVLRAVGSNIDSADVVCQGTSADVDSRAAKYLDSWPNIRHLGIHINDQPSFHDMTNFFYNVSRMQQLVSLELATANVSAWLELQSGTPPNLSHFSLYGIRNLDLMQLAGVLTYEPVISLCLRQFSVSNFLPPIGVLMAFGSSTSPFPDVRRLDFSIFRLGPAQECRVLREPPRRFSSEHQRKAVESVHPQALRNPLFLQDRSCTSQSVGGLVGDQSLAGAARHLRPRDHGRVTGLLEVGSDEHEQLGRNAACRTCARETSLVKLDPDPFWTAPGETSLLSFLAT